MSSNTVGRTATLLGSLLDALADGDGTAAAIRTRLRDELGRRDSLTAELAHLEKAAPVDVEALVRAATERAADLHGLLARNVAQAPQVVRQLLEGRLVCQPFEDNGIRTRVSALTVITTFHDQDYHGVSAGDPRVDPP